MVNKRYPYKEEIKLKDSIFGESLTIGGGLKVSKLTCYICNKSVNKGEVEEITVSDAIYLVCEKCKLTHIKCLNILKK